MSRTQEPSKAKFSKVDIALVCDASISGVMDVICGEKDPSVCTTAAAKTLKQRQGTSAFPMGGNEVGSSNLTLVSTYE
jgi:hypothetical protein